MKKIAALSITLLALGAFVYFYEIEGQKKREEARELEESLLRLKQDEISSIQILRADQDPVRLQKEGQEWTIREPIETAADGSAVDSFLGNLDSARRDRTLEGEPQEAERYGLNEPRMTLKISGDETDRTLLIGRDDFTGSKIYAQIQGSPEIFLTSDLLYTTADKEVNDWRSKKILAFERGKVQGIEIVNPSAEIRLARQDSDWVLESPIQERADQSSVSSLLSKLEFAEAQAFVAEQPDDLKSYGLDTPRVTVRVRQEGEDHWRSMELGDKKEDDYLARNPDRAPVFTVKEDVFEQLTGEVWTFRDKDVVDVDQDEVTRLSIRRGEEEIALRHEEFKWIVEQPESHKDKEALAYKFWYPIDDIKFESIDEEGAGASEFPEPEVQVMFTLKDGSTQTFDFARKGEEYRARRSGSGRSGSISQESYEKLQIQPDDIVE